MNPKYWGNEYVPEGVNRLLQYCFEELEVELVWCGHFDFNYRSKRVNEKCGFKYCFTSEDILKDLDNKKVNVMYYTMFKEDYYKRNKISIS